MIVLHSSINEICQEEFVNVYKPGFFKYAAWPFQYLQIEMELAECTVEGIQWHLFYFV